MDISSVSAATPSSGPSEIQQAVLQKKQIERQQVQTQQLIDSAHTTPHNENGSSSSTVGQNLNATA